MAVPVTKGVIYLGIGGNGFQEDYYFTEASLVACIPILKRIVWARSAFLPKNAEIDFARVSFVDTPRDGLNVQMPWPLGPHPSWQAAGPGPVGDVIDTVNDYKVCIQMRFERDNGHFWQRYLRLVCDSWIVNKKPVVQVLPYLTPLDAGTPIGDPSPAGGLSHLEVCRTYWSLLLRDTNYLNTPRVGAKNIQPFQFISYAQVTTKKMGRRFRTGAGRLPKAG